MSLRLRDLIKEIRACKTQQEEREVIQRESAAIRQSFRSEEGEFRHRNVAKMIYIHMMGYPTYWGQMECLKLISSQLFTDKRMGYLGVMLLIDEKQEILTLVTQCLKNDLNHPSHFISGLALVSMGNISSADIARDLAPDVEKLLGSKNPYVRKKAALCAIRTLRKCPDLMENFVPRIRALLGERNHGVLVTGVTLMSEVCEADPVNIEFFRKLVPTLVRMLKTLASGGLAPEYDVAGVTDPFLQVKILRLLRVLGRDHAEASDAMSDTLAQVATNTDHSRNVGNSVLYECVLTIFEVAADDELRALAINVLARFLQHRDNNIRYVALSTLARVVSKDADAVQRHRNTIVECLKDTDISIRKRALELIYALVNEGNIKVLVAELLNFLAVASAEFRPGLVAQLCVVVEKFSPSSRFRIDKILQVMQLAGTYVADEVAASLIALISNESTENQAYAVQAMYVALTAHPEQAVVVSTASWVLGEFGDLLTSQGTIRSIAVVEALARTLSSSITASSARGIVVTALVKLCDRFKGVDPEAVSAIRKVLAQHTTSADVEVQQRACEYLRILSLPDTTRNTVLERMPIVTKRMGHDGSGKIEAAPAGHAGDLLGDMDMPMANTGGSVTTGAVAASSAGGLLDDIFSSGPVTRSAPAASAGNDLLGDLLGGGPSLAPQAKPTASSFGGDLLGDLLGGGSSAPAPSGGSFVAFNKNNCLITFKPQKDAHDRISCTAVVTTTGSIPLSNFDFKIAVPGYLALQLSPPSGTTVAPGGQITQQFTLQNKDAGQPNNFSAQYKAALAVATHHAEAAATAQREGDLAQAQVALRMQKQAEAQAEELSAKSAAAKQGSNSPYLIKVRVEFAGFPADVSDVSFEGKF